MKLLGVFLLIAIIENANGQVNKHFLQIIGRTFGDEKIFSILFQKDSSVERLIYINANEIVTDQFENYDSLYGKMTIKNDMTFRAEFEGVKFIFFLEAMILRPRVSIERVVVIDKYRITNNNSTLSFRTTNLESKYHNDRVHHKTIFYKVTVNLSLEGSKWKVIGFKKKECKPISIDDE